MNLSTHIYRGLVTLALCAAVSAYAASHSNSTPADTAIPTLGTITVTAPHDDANENVVYTQTQGRARVTVGEPITLGPKVALPQLAMQ
jgi:hypothetical protein